MLISLLIIIEVLVCLMLALLILVQKSKSEGLGMAFGAGAGESLFGARAGNVLTKATIYLGAVFLANTLFLGVLFSRSSDESIASKLSSDVQSAPQAEAPAEMMFDLDDALPEPDSE
jgi:preprotein translocase subunit SecG